MLIGHRLRQLREVRDLSQGDIENRTGLMRPYVSRVENGHTVPALETLEKFARALQVPLYQLFYDGDESSAPIPLPAANRRQEHAWGTRRREAHYLEQMCLLLSRMKEFDRQLLLSVTQKMARRRKSAVRR